jgi:hypothetical protein
MLLFAFVALAVSVTIDLGAELASLDVTTKSSVGFGPDSALGIYAGDYAQGTAALSGLVALSSFDKGTTTGISGVGDSTFTGWYYNNLGAHYVPLVLVNTGSSDAAWQNNPAISMFSKIPVSTPPGDLAMHGGTGAGAGGQYNAVIYRWTAPYAGTISTAAADSIVFTYADNGASFVDVKIAGTSQGGVENTPGQHNGKATYAFNLAVSQYDNVDFIVTWVNGNSQGSVNLHAQFDFTPMNFPSGTE